MKLSYLGIALLTMFVGFGCDSSDSNGGNNNNNNDGGNNVNDAGGEMDAGADAMADGSSMMTMEDPPPSHPLFCDDGVVIGRFAEWGGKVNVWDDGSGWKTDPDCSSGAGQNPLSYCKKFWSSVTEAKVLMSVSSENKPFNTGTCSQVFNNPGQKEVQCCGPATQICGQGGTLQGQFAEWSGKVNVHTNDDGGWEVDSDCSSGAGQTALTYCKKFWPNTNNAVEVIVSNEDKPFTSSGCGTDYDAPGQQQYACCTSLQ